MTTLAMIDWVDTGYRALFAFGFTCFLALVVLMVSTVCDVLTGRGYMDDSRLDDEPGCTCRWGLPQPFDPACPVHGDDDEEAA